MKHIKTYDLFENQYSLEQQSLNEDTGVIEKNINIKEPQRSRLINVLKGLETKHHVKFTQKHFDDEVKLSGGIKLENGGYNPAALSAFKQLQQACKGKGLYYDEDSYRTYEKQGELFGLLLTKWGTIDKAMGLRSIPGYSQHHTGKAFDIKPDEARPAVAQNAAKFGFIFPYKEDGIRMAEPWHIYYNK